MLNMLEGGGECLEQASGQEEQLSDTLVESYLCARPHFLYHYLLAHQEVIGDRCQRWLDTIKEQEGREDKKLFERIRHMDRSSSDEEWFSQWKLGFCHLVLGDFLHQIRGVVSSSDIPHLVFMTTVILMDAGQADDARVFLVSSYSNRELVHYHHRPPIFAGEPLEITGKTNAIASLTAHRQEPILVADYGYDKDYLISPPLKGHRDVGSVIGCPLYLYPGHLIAVAEFYRFFGNFPFLTSDLHCMTTFSHVLTDLLFKKYLITNYEHSMEGNSLPFKLLEREQEINDNDIVETVNIGMNYFRKVLAAERWVVYGVDNANDQVFRHMVLVGRDGDGEDVVENRLDYITQPRHDLPQGVVGEAVRKDTCVIIECAHLSTLINSNLDGLADAKLSSLLAIPIHDNQKRVVAVVEFVNTTDSRGFTTLCLSKLAMLRPFILLLIKLSLCLDGKQIASKHNLVYRDKLEFYTTHSEAELEQLICVCEQEKMIHSYVPAEFMSHSLVFTHLQEELLPCLHVYMFIDLVGENLVEVADLASFVLRIHKLHRPDMPWHNYELKFLSLHALHYLLLKTGDLFSQVEKFALFVGLSLRKIDYHFQDGDNTDIIYGCHHMEQHSKHIREFVLSIQSNNILQRFRESEKNVILPLITQTCAEWGCFRHKKKLEAWHRNGLLNLKKNKHQRHVFGLLLAELASFCGSFKPWSTHVDLVMKQYDEYFMVGDRDRARGVEPGFIYDRKMKDTVPQQHIGFLRDVCLSCLDTVRLVAPSMALDELVADVQANMSKWREIVRARAGSSWRNIEKKVLQHRSWGTRHASWRK